MVCSLAETSVVFCKSNCILMVDGDEPRMRKCRKTVLSERDYSVIVLPYVKNIKLGNKIFQLEK